MAKGSMSTKAKLPRVIAKVINKAEPVKMAVGGMAKKPSKGGKC